MQSRLSVAALALILGAALLAPLPADAGSQTDPEATDPAEDVDIDSPSPADPINGQEDFGEADLLKVWVNETQMVPTFLVAVETVANHTEDVEMTVSFVIQRGPDTVFESDATEEGTAHEIQLSGANATGVEGAVAFAAGNVLLVLVPKASVGVLGGEVLTGLGVTTSVEKPIAVLPVNETGTDDLSNAELRDYTFSRPPSVPGIEVEVTSNAAFETEDPDATYTVSLRVTNSGSDPDDYEVSVANAAELEGVDVAIDRATGTLDPGQTAELDAEVTLDSAPDGAQSIQFQVTSENGGLDGAAASLTVAATGPPPTTTTTSPSPTTTTPADEERNATPSGLDFLTPLAEALGFDELFGDAAELVLLMLIVLIVLVLIVLLLFFLAARRPWLELEVTPKRQDVAPGGDAEFEVSVRNVKSRFRESRARIRMEDPEWRMGLLMSQEDGATLDPVTEPHETLALPLTARKQPGDRYRGSLRVQAPERADPKQRNRLTLTVTPLDDDGEENEKKARQARVAVVVTDAEPEASVDGAPPIRLSEVRHTPAEPEAGQLVTTRAALENDDPGQWHTMRVVLEIDGEAHQEKTFKLPPRRARAVLFTWRAGDADNRVHLRVYEVS